MGFELGMILALIAGGGTAIGFIGLARDRAAGREFDSRLAQYGLSAGGGRAGMVGLAPPAPVDLRERLNRLLQPAAERISQRGVSRGRPSLADNLSKADLKLRTSEFLAIQIAVAGLLGLIFLYRFNVGLQFIIAAVGGYFLPGLYVRFRQAGRLRAFNDQLSDTLVLLSNALKAGYSFAQAVDTVAKNGSPPVSDEFGRAVREMNLGGSVDEALFNMVRRIDSPDLDLMVTAVGIHRQVGGNLAEILDNIAETIRHRIRIKGEIRTLTAQATLSGWIITLLPIALAIFMYFVTPTYFTPMVKDPFGIAMIVIALFFILVGNAIVRRITKIEV